METLSKDDLSALVKKRKDLCISIYMPTHRSGVETQQNHIRFKNLLREAEERLVASGMRVQDTRSFLEPALSLVNNVLFWRQQQDCLAIFLSSDLFLHYNLPVSVGDVVVVTDRFHIKPLLTVLSRDERFYLLTLSQNDVKLYEGTRLSIREVPVKGLPRGITEALQTDEPEKQVRFRSGGMGGERGSMMSGHGADVEDTKDNLLRYFRQVDRALEDVLQEEKVPLILMGVEYHFPIYREVNTYSELFEEAVTGNPKGMTMDQLHKEAWALVSARYDQTIAAAVDLYQQSQGTGLTSSDIKDILTAAHHGRIGVIFVPLGKQLWGSFKSDSGRVKLYDEPVTGSEDLFDLAAIQTYINGGSVFAIPPEEIPDGRAVAALYRY
ncbi:MAG: hypothetical protein JW902_03780 [Syntrophaceae bacterium]|nr:hypothetical protein [Syntrophaceae bacterium]